MAEGGKSDDKFEEDVWKSLIEKVKKENRAANQQPIDKIPPKREKVLEKPIERQTIDNIEKIPLEKPIESESIEEEHVKPTVKPKKPEKSGKFTTIMITKELKEKLASQKQGKESYGDVLERLLKSSG